ncbi:MAG: mycofactocin radical SAM maturase [Microthrixaceae bacterium]
MSETTIPVAIGRSVPSAAAQPPAATRSLTDDFKLGLEAPICLTWELTYACNLACRHCLSSSGRRDPAELTTEECFGVVDELQRLGVFYVNLGGGEPMLRRDFFDIVEYSTAHDVGVKFSTNGTYIDAPAARRLASMDYLDIQLSIDGATAAVNDDVRGEGSFATARAAMDHLAAAEFGAFKISVVVTRQNADQLDEFRAIAADYGAQLRITRLRPSGRGADTWDELHPTQQQQRDLYHWLLDRPDVLTGDSFFHLNALGSEQLSGLNLCGAGRVVCLIDPIGDVYACPFVIHDEFLAGNVRDEGGFSGVWKGSELFRSLREPTSAGACASCGAYDACQGGCMASKFFVGLELDDPDPECVLGHGEAELERKRAAGELVGVGALPRPGQDHSRPGATVPVSIGQRPG